MYRKFLTKFSGASPPNSKFINQILNYLFSFLQYLNIKWTFYFSNYIPVKILRAQRVERAGPRPFTQRAGPKKVGPCAPLIEIQIEI